MLVCVYVRSRAGAEAPRSRDVAIHDSSHAYWIQLDMLGPWDLVIGAVISVLFCSRPSTVHSNLKGYGDGDGGRCDSPTVDTLPRFYVLAR